ncbi:MAG TPA: SPFH domain-containing protein [Terriglobales bacterium]|jgi:regulator of protease activity HflC (stomatin/prohibitin superfamily)|nr:SPFH domain-containing protein [Terriglobales bacterium]
MDSSQTVMLVFYGIIALVILGAILSGLFQVETAAAVVVQRMGKFQRVATAGMNFKVPYIDQIAGRIDLRVQQLALDVETKTKDNVFVKIPVSVQYHVIPEKVYEAFYKLANPKQQISSYVFNVILGHVPKMNLDDAFLQQSDIAIAIKQGLDDVMQTYGYAIDQALVTDIQPDEKVKAAMNEINAAQREQVAASARGEAEKILKVKQAEAEAESKALQGQGIANQRKAIIEGLKQSIEAFSAAVEGATAKDVMMLVLVTQYLDTIKEIGAQDKSNTLFMSHSPAAMGDLFRQLQDAVMIGQKAAAAGV